MKPSAHHIIATGTPEQIAKAKESYTGQFLKPMIR
jgi:excinuclease UvrABC ATPase subunit